MIERTFAMIKPDAVRAGHTGAIISAIEKNGFSVVGMRKTRLTRELAQTFYAVHAQRSFFNEMLDTITAGPVIVLALEKENAVQAWRDLIGATNPAEAKPGTMRQLYGTSIGSNAVHGSDAKNTAQEELSLFFGKPDLLIK